MAPDQELEQAKQRIAALEQELAESNRRRLMLWESVNSWADRWQMTHTPAFQNMLALFHLSRVDDSGTDQSGD